MVMLFPQLVRTNVADLLLTCSDGNIWWKFLFGSYIPRCRLESVIAKYSKHPHRCSDWQTDTHTPQNIRFICAGAVPTHNPRNEDNSASNCNSRFLSRDGDKDAKITDCSFNKQMTLINQFLLVNQNIQQDKCIWFMKKWFLRTSSFYWIKTYNIQQ